MAGRDTWKTNSFRNHIIQKIVRAVDESRQNLSQKIIDQLERDIFSKARDKEDYLNLSAKLLLEIKETKHKDSSSSLRSGRHDHNSQKYDHPREDSRSSRDHLSSAVLSHRIDDRPHRLDRFSNGDQRYSRSDANERRYEDPYRSGADRKYTGDELRYKMSKRSPVPLMSLRIEDREMQRPSEEYHRSSNTKYTSHREKFPVESSPRDKYSTVSSSRDRYPTERSTREKYPAADPSRQKYSTSNSPREKFPVENRRRDDKVMLVRYVRGNPRSIPSEILEREYGRGKSLELDRRERDKIRDRKEYSLSQKDKRENYRVEDRRATQTRREIPRLAESRRDLKLHYRPAVPIQNDRKSGISSPTKRRIAVQSSSRLRRDEIIDSRRPNLNSMIRYRKPAESGVKSRLGTRPVIRNRKMDIRVPVRKRVSDLSSRVVARRTKSGTTKLLSLRSETVKRPRGTMNRVISRKRQLAASDNIKARAKKINFNSRKSMSPPPAPRLTLRKKELVNSSKSKTRDFAKDSGSQKRSSLRVGITHVDYPDRILTEEQLTQLQQAVIRAVEDIPDQGPQVRFEHCTFDSGVLLIQCADMRSFYWIENNVTHLRPWEGCQLKAVTNESKLPKPKIYKVFIPDEPNGTRLSGSVALTRLKKMNHGLQTEDWKILDSEKKSNGQLYTFSVDKKSLPFLEKLEFQPYFGFGQVQFKKK